jgi:hypothetical protein
MRLSKRMLAVSGLTGLLAAVAASPAFADPGGAAACTVSGQALTNPPVQLTGGGGTYSFNSNQGASAGLQLNCLAANTAGDAGVITVTTTSNGNYTNTVCGTGTADSTLNQITGVNVRAGTPGIGPWAQAQQDDLDYHIQFAGTVGALTFTSGAGQATGGGPIQIADPTPANTAPFEAAHGANDCTTDFQVTGSLVGSVPAE